MLTADEIRIKVNEYLNSLAYDRKPASLYEPIKYVLSMGGKRIRPVLMLLAYNMYKNDPESILPTACALETYHNYTLLHDDLMDNADMRRGHETVHKKWDANTAILSGDSMLVLAYDRMMGCKPKYMHDVLRMFTETALEIGEGQQYDMDFETRNDVKEDDYIEMIRLKTSVLLACALYIGAIQADAPHDDVMNLYKFGEKIGLAFQLQDDFLDVYGNPKIFGKAIGGDITSNKKTYMLINALLLADKEQKDKLNYWIGLKEFDKQQKIKAVTELYDEIGIKDLCEKKIASYFDEANKFLDKIKLDESKKKNLRDFSASMMKRKY